MAFYCFTIVCIASLSNSQLFSQFAGSDSLVLFTHNSGYKISYPAGWWQDGRGSNLLVYLVEKKGGVYPTDKFSIIKEKVTEGHSLQQFVSNYKTRSIAVYRNYGATFQFLPDSIQTLSGIESVRLQCAVPEWKQQKIIWIVPYGNEFFLLEFTALEENYFQLLPLVEKAVTSFQFIR